MSTFNYGNVPPFQPQQYSSIPVNYQNPVQPLNNPNVQTYGQPSVQTNVPISDQIQHSVEGMNVKGMNVLGIIITIIVILLVIFLIMFIITYFKNKTQNQLNITIDGGLTGNSNKPSRSMLNNPASTGRTGRVTMLETFYSMFTPMSYGRNRTIPQPPQIKRSHPARRMNPSRTIASTSNESKVDTFIQDLNKLDTDIMVISSDIARIRDKTSKLTSMSTLSKASGEISAPKIDNIASIVSAINNVILELSLKQELINNKKRSIMEYITKNNRAEAEKLYNNYTEEINKCKQHISDLESKLTTIDNMLTGNPKARNAIDEMSSKIAKSSKPLTRIALDDPQLKALFSQPISTDIKSQFPITTSLTGNQDISGSVKKIKESV